MRNTAKNIFAAVGGLGFIVAPFVKPLNYKDTKGMEVRKGWRICIWD